MKNHKGFTLIELLIAIAVVAITAAVAFPHIMGWMPNYRLKSAAKDLYSAMQKAKITALKYNSNVIIVFTTGTYAPAGKIGGYFIFIDNSPANGSFDTGETIISQVSMPANVSLYYSSFAANTTGFNSRGMPWNNRWGNVQMRNNNSRYYKITLSSAGSFTMTMSSNGTTWF